VNARVLDLMFGRRVLQTVWRDITEQKRAEEELRQQSIIDELTGLNNRRGFLILAKQHLKIADRLKSEVAIIYADMDNLKAINDTFGHKEGDRALLDLANVMRSTLRASDIVARWGGDEFVGLVLESTQGAGEVVCAHLLEKLNAHNVEGTRPFKLSISFGLARYNPAEPCGIEELLERADRLMYAHKYNKR
jgi:diguanylate cyclase (GGDEF)-like protein